MSKNILAKSNFQLTERHSKVPSSAIEKCRTCGSTCMVHKYYSHDHTDRTYIEYEEPETSKRMLEIINRLVKAEIVTYPGSELDNLQFDARELINELNK